MRQPRKMPSRRGAAATVATGQRGFVVSGRRGGERQEETGGNPKREKLSAAHTDAADERDPRHDLPGTRTAPDAQSGIAGERDMKAFFSKRKDGGKANSDSSLYPPPSVATRRPKMPSTDPLDLAMDSAAAGEPWDGKCRKCRKLMSRCLCYEDASGGHGNYMFVDGSTSSTKSASASEKENDKRLLLETLSGMHQSRSKSRVPLKMTQDRLRDRRMKEAQREPSATILSMASTEPFTPMRSVSAKPLEYDDPSSPSGRFTRSCGDVKWRSSSAITSTMRLAHERDVVPPRSAATPKNLLKYDSKKPTNRYNHGHSNATPPVAPKAKAKQNVPSGNSYLILPVSKADDFPDEDENFPKVWEL